MTTNSKIGRYGCLSAMFVAMSGFLASCSMFDSSDAKIDYIPVKESKDDKWGMLGSDGEFLFLDEFENAPTVVTEGFFSVMEGSDNLYTVYKAEKKPQVLKGCEGLKDVGMMMEGKMPLVRKGERITVINPSGKTLFEIKPYKDKEIVEAAGYYTEGMLSVKTEDGKYGFINANGEIVIKPEYDFVNVFSEGACIVGNRKNDDSYETKYYIINKKGEKVYSFKDDVTVKSVFGDLIVVEQGDRIRILNNKGEEKLKCPAKVKNISDIEGNKYVFYSGDAYGVMDMDDNVVIRAKYESIIAYDDNTFFCEKEGDKGYDIIDGKGEIVSSVDVDYIYNIPGFGIIGGDRNDGYVMDKKGEKKGKKTFYDTAIRMQAYVVSDYFDSSAVAQVMVNLLEGDTFSKHGFKFGASAPGISMFKSKDIDDLPSYSDEYSWEVADAMNYTIKAEVGFSSNFKKYEYGYDSNYDWFSGYVLNPEAKVTMLALETTLKKSDHSTDVGEALVKAMKSKGYKEVGVKKCAALFTKSNVIYLAAWKADEDTMGVLMLENKDRNLEYMKNAFDKISDDSSNLGQAIDEVEGEYVVEDTMAVEVEAAAED